MQSQSLEHTIRRTASQIVPVLVEIDRGHQAVKILDESGERAPIVLRNWHAKAFIARFDALLNADEAPDVTLEAAAKYLAAPHIRCAWREPVAMR
jgi:hypothetical protein